ncbi:acyl-CoA dehydrogenase family protein [Sphingomonas dokdonensis]|uniref:Acyl-CoA dehydrogenase n=1 Tax=Sphingomonas dokdonensis TaxID=344880 RepID=A0A245ZTX9_9SPHN|nr:acyl-CoA dehydrogenase family protein [Sphingomonas dokdonensis]OWK33180.1 acyl-CoA dehydrogenase [Sphingomonas dokdonensis]
MDLALSPAEQAFAADIRRFFSQEYPQDVLALVRDGRKLTRDDHVRSQQALNAKGWLGVGWPAEHGGPGWTPVERYLFEQELELAGAPSIIPMAVIYIGPIICAFGTPEQQGRWLPDILESRAMWAQGYSEPESGSDLASLRMSAVRDGDDYVLNGTKIWTSGAHWADWIFCLVRTEKCERKQDGISMICADMRTPGITVHPIISIDGAHELNRVEFDNVRVPAANMIGEPGKGWHYANVLLAAERVSYAHIGRKRADLAELRRVAATMPGSVAATMADEPLFARRVALAEIRLNAVEMSVLRVLCGDAAPAAVSALKIACTELAQEITELWVELAGRDRAIVADRTRADWRDAAPEAAPFAVPRTASYLFERAQTIYGGATEIQKTIVWRALDRANAGIARS